jgi:hypothetical protein
MSHINALQMFFDLKKAGFSDDQAEAQAKAADNAVSQILSEFASNKLLAGIGAIIIAIGGFTLAELWYLSKEVSVLSRDMQEVRQHIFKIG